MIYAASTAMATKKAFGSKCKQSSIKKIIELMPIDPVHSEMEVVILSARDLAGDSTGKVQAAVKAKHPNVCVIYLPANDKELKLLQGTYVHQTKSVNAEEIKTAVKTYYGEHVKTVPKEKVHSSYDTVEKEVVEKPKEVIEESKAVVEEVIPEPVAKEELEPIKVEFEAEPPKSPVPAKSTPVKLSLEEKIENVKDFHDWDFLIESAKKDSITRQLLEENTEYQGLQSMLDLWDIRIRDTFHSPTLSPIEKFEKIKEFGQQRTALKASANDIYCNKLSDIISAIVTSASNTVNSYLDGVKESVDKISMDKDSLIDYMNVQPLLDERLSAEVELLGVIKSLYKVYQAMDGSVEEAKKSMDEGLPSSNDFICEVMKPASNVFRPSNAAELATNIMNSLQRGNITMSSLESSIQAVIDRIFKLAKKDEEIIQYQKTVNDLLRAHRVEDIVIRDSLIKDCMYLFVGADGTGRTATALAWAGMMSRRANTLVLDFSNNSKMSNYGTGVISLNDFMTKNIEQHFLCVKGDLHDDAEVTFNVMKEIRNKISYYGCVVVILDTKQSDALDQFSEDALSVTYVTDCTHDSMESIKKVVEEHTYENIAHKLVAIDSPVPLIEIVTAVSCDVTRTRVISIPHIPEMKACAIRGIMPHDNTKILSIFEEAFK